MNWYRMGGVAANQLGSTDKIAILNLGDELKAIVNPEYEFLSKQTKAGFEGCYSFPLWFRALVRRSETVIVKGLSREGHELVLPLTGKFAIAAQHEIDHLNGILMIDRRKRARFLAQWEIGVAV